MWLMETAQLYGLLPMVYRPHTSRQYSVGSPRKLKLLSEPRHQDLTLLQTGQFKFTELAEPQSTVSTEHSSSQHSSRTGPACHTKCEKKTENTVSTIRTRETKKPATNRKNKQKRKSGCYMN